MPFATECNTSPVSALLRVMAMIDKKEVDNTSAIIEGKALDKKCLNVCNDVAQDAQLNARKMLKPIDEWMSRLDESQTSLILRRSMLVTSTGLAATKDDDDEEAPQMGSSVKDLLGGIGRDNLPGHEIEDLNAFDIYNTSAQSIKAAERVNGSSAAHSNNSVEPAVKIGAEPHVILRCYVHERVVRNLKSRLMPISFIRNIVKDKIIGGALTRERQQYQKLVTRDVLELRIDEKIRVLYARSKNAVLIIEIVWNHKLDKPIKRAQQEMSVMQNWMEASGYADEEPFVMIDWVSGRLRPLYIINISYDAESGEVDDENKVFNPSMLHLVLSPQQKQACEHAMSATNEANDVDMTDAQEGVIDHVTVVRPTLNIVVFQGSAGNGKTTCLLRTGLQRAKIGETVIFVAATQIFADSVEQDLRGSISKDFRIIVRNEFTIMIRSLFSVDLAEEEQSSTEATDADVNQWLDEVESKKGKKMGKGAIRALSDWLMKGHRETKDTEGYVEYVKAYIAWKKEMKKRDEGDMWKYVLLKLIAENRAEDNEEADNASKNRYLRDIDRECDMLVIDEAQLYPAETYFQALLLWYRPRKTLLLGMDTKQAVYLGCSNRRALLKAVNDSGWLQRKVMSYSFTTNFRLPARLVALSNAMVSTLRMYFPKVFDEYKHDDGFESRSAICSKVADTVASAEAMDASVRAIERYPAMLVIGAAAVKLRKEICVRMDANRRSVLCMRFAHISSESAPANLNTPAKDVGCVLSDLPTIKFQAVSGLEISLPVIVDSLLTTYIEELCPRKIFASVKRGKDVEDHEMNMLRTALCTVYTVLTRCRGPLVWLEDNLRTDLEKCHPLVVTLTDELKNGIMNIDIVTDQAQIDKKFVDRLFNVTDIEEINAAYEDSTCQILQKFKNSFWSAVGVLKRMLRDRKASGAPTRGERDISSAFSDSEEYTTLMADKCILLSQLSMAAHSGTDLCCSFLDSVCDTLLLKAGTGDGTWAAEWGPELRDLLQAMDLFPDTARMVLQDTTKEIAPAALWVQDGSPMRTLTMESQLSREALRICSCGEGPQAQDLQFLLAFRGPVLNILGDASATTEGAVWVIHHVSGMRTRSAEASVYLSKTLLDAAAADSPESCPPCITEDSYILSCFSGDINDRDYSRSTTSRMNAILHKCEGASELTLTRACDGWLTLQERVLVPGAGLIRSTSLNMGLKCRCRAKGVRLAGSAKRHSSGPFVIEVEGTLMGANSSDADSGPKTLDLDVLRMPPVGDERMISLLESIFSGQGMDMHTLDALSLPGSSTSKYRSAGAFVWNNLMADKLVFVGVEARLQPWAMLLPSVIAAMGTGAGPEQEVVAYALLDQVRRAVEACLIRDQAAMDVTYKGEQGRSEAPPPLVVSRKRIRDIAKAVSPISPGPTRAVIAGSELEESPHHLKRAVIADTRSVGWGAPTPSNR